MTASVTENAELFASIDGMAASLGGQEVVFLNRESGESHVMTADVLQAMSLCRQFQPLAAHVNTIEQQIPALQGQSAAITKVLEYLRNRGLLRSAEDLVRQSAAPATEPAPTNQIVIRTCDRPVCLNRLLNSLVDYQQQFAVQRPLLVFDDSKTASGTQQNQKLIASARGLGLEVRYCSRDWRIALTTKAAEQTGIAPDTVAQLLAGDQASSVFSGGQIWNAALLATAGNGLFMLDDDFSADFRQRSSAHNALEFAQERERPVTFSPTMDRFEQQLHRIDYDVFAHAAALNGGGLAAAMNAGAELSSASLLGLNWSLVERMLTDTTIKSTAIGTWGDAGMASNLWFYMMPKQWLAGWLDNQETYFAQLKRPLVAHSFDHFQLTTLNPMLPFSIDNTELVPPASPLGRGEDLFFAASMAYLYPKSVALNLPVMVSHRRPDNEIRPEQEPHALTPSLARLAAEYCLSRVDQCSASDPVDRCHFMASTLLDLARSENSNRRRVLGEFLLHLRADTVAQIQQNLAPENNLPAYFSRDAKQWVVANGKTFNNDLSLQLEQWPQSLDAEQAARRFSAELESLGSALSVWPRLWQWAKEQDDLLSSEVDG